MKIKVIGINTSKGSFTDKDSGQVIEFDNLIFFGERAPIDNYTIGNSIEIIKIKRSLVDLPQMDLPGLIGSICSFDIAKQTGYHSYTATEFELR